MRRLRMRRSGIGRRWSVGEVPACDSCLRKDCVTRICTDDTDLGAKGLVEAARGERGGSGEAATVRQS
jgi:hypothetical protein